jgi:hypothetical protein
MVAEQMHRRFIGCDIGPAALHIARRRVLGVAPRRPLDVLGIVTGSVKSRGREQAIQDTPLALNGAVLDVQIAATPDNVQITLSDKGTAQGGGPRHASTSVAALRVADIDMWAVDPQWEEGRPFNGAWFASRKRNSRSPNSGHLQVASPLLARKPGTHVWVKAWDQKGQLAEARHLIVSKVARREG